MTGAGEQGIPALVGTRIGPRGAALRAAAGVTALALFGVIVRYLAWRWSTGETGVGDYVEAFCVWDCAWYRTIVENGYDLEPGMRLLPGGANWAFFPLYPTIAALIRWPTGLDAQVIGFVLSNLFTISTVLAARPLFEGNERAWWLFAFILTAGPFAFLSSILYTESLFMLLTVLVLRMLQRRSYLAAGLLAGLLSATRATGVLMGAAILVQMLLDHVRDGGRLAGFPRRLLAEPRLLLGLVLAPLGLVLYAGYLYWRVGDALAFAHIQRAWNREPVNPLWALWDGLSQSLTPTADAQVITVWSWAVVLGLVLTLVLALRRRWAAAVFSLLCILLSLSTGVGSMVRFIAGLAPLWIAAAELLAVSRWVAALSLPPLLLADVALTIGWFRSSLVVM